jgi:hypothetical protein
VKFKLFTSKRIFNFIWVLILFTQGACVKKVEPTIVPILETPTLILSTPTVYQLPGCWRTPAEPPADPGDASLFPAVGENDHIRGPIKALITIVEYGDFNARVALRWRQF